MANQTFAERMAERPQLKVYWDMHLVGLNNRGYSEASTLDSDRRYLRIEELTLPSMQFDDVPVEGYGEVVHFLGGFRFSNMEMMVVESEKLTLLREILETYSGSSRGLSGVPSMEESQARFLSASGGYKKDFHFHLYNMKDGNPNPEYLTPYVDVFVLGASLLGIPSMVVSHKNVQDKLMYKFTFAVDYMYYQYGETK